MNVLKVTPQQVDLFSLVEKANESANPIFRKRSKLSQNMISAC